MMAGAHPLGEQFLANSEVLLTEVGDGTGVLLHLGTKFYFTLNVTGVVMWQALVDGGVAGMSTIALAQHIGERFEVDASTARCDLARILEEMLSEGLVVGRKE